MQPSSSSSSSGRQRLKDSVSLIEHYLADINLIFDKELLSLAGHDGTQYIEFSWLQERIPLLAELNANQLRRAIKYDAKERLELHPELDMVRKVKPFDETQAMDRMLFVDEVDISGHEDDPSQVFIELLLPTSHSLILAHSQGTDLDDPPSPSSDTISQEEREEVDMIVIKQTVIRPFGYKQTRFFQGFCFVEYPSKDLCAVMESTILSRSNAVRVMPMVQWRRLERTYQNYKHQ